MFLHFFALGDGEIALDHGGRSALGIGVTSGVTMGEKMPSEPSLPEILIQLSEILQSVRIQEKTNPAP